MDFNRIRRVCSTLNLPYPIECYSQKSLYILAHKAYPRSFPKYFEGFDYIDPDSDMLTMDDQYNLVSKCNGSHNEMSIYLRSLDKNKREKILSISLDGQTFGDTLLKNGDMKMFISTFCK